MKVDIVAFPFKLILKSAVKVKRYSQVFKRVASTFSRVILFGIGTNSLSKNGLLLLVQTHFRSSINFLSMFRVRTGG